jgi:thymidylate kinase
MIEWSLSNKIHLWIKRIMRKADKNGLSSQDTEKDDRGFHEKNLIINFVLRIMAFVDLLRFRLLSLYQDVIKKRIIVCDRYFYDIGIQMEYKGRAGKRWRDFYLRQAQMPDFAFLLNVEPEIARSRKPEHPDGFYSHKFRMYEELGRRQGMIILRNRSIQDIQKTIRKHLSRALRVSHS